MTWNDYLKALSDALEAVAPGGGPISDDPETRASTLQVRYDPRHQSSSAQECLIGVGRHWHRGQVATRPVEHLGICLNDKDLALPGVAGQGVTVLALKAPDALFDGWARLVGADAEPKRFFATYTLVVEDASPDSCFGLVVLLARLNGVEAAEVPESWTGYTRQWEHGASRVTDPFRAWGPLVSALSHGYWDMDAFRALCDPAGAAADAAEASAALDLALARAWLACLRFTTALLRAGSPPEPIGDLPPCAEAERAHAFLTYEHQVYLQTLQQAETLQLLLPLDAPGGRRKIVDACLLEETTVTGTNKIFLRNDREHTWLHDGFGLMALYRPGLAGSGDDMTISVDRVTGVDLKELWQRLEALEDSAWGGARPCGDPREVAAYPGGRRPGGIEPSPDQPWWDDRGTYTLLAAPRRMADGRLGSRLRWREDVLEALWACYRPVRDLRMIDDRGELRPVEECSPRPLEKTGKRRLLLRWPRGHSARPGAVVAAAAEPGEYGDQPVDSVLLTPTLKRCLAALVAEPRDPGVHRLGLSGLPSAEGFDFIPVSGGYVLAHGDGVVILDDWRSTPLCETEIDESIARVARRLTLLQDRGAEARALLDRLGKRIAGRRLRGIASGAVLDRLAETKVRLRQGLNDTEAVGDDASLGQVHACLERRWGIASQLRSIDRTIDEMEQTLRSYAELRSTRFINFLTVIGFPLALFAGFFQFAVADMPREWSSLPAWFLADGGKGPHWPALLTFLGLSVLVMGLIWLVRPLLRWFTRLPWRNRSG